MHTFTVYSVDGGYILICKDCTNLSKHSANHLVGNSDSFTVHDPNILG